MFIAVGTVPSLIGEPPAAAIYDLDRDPKKLQQDSFG
jgi:hypothetical protein